LSGRFARLFTDPDFARDKESESYKRIRSTLSKKELEENFSELEDDEGDDEDEDNDNDQELGEDESDEDEKSEEEEELETEKLVKELQQMRQSPQNTAKKSVPPSVAKPQQSQKAKNLPKKRKIRFFESKEDTFNPLGPTQVKKQKLEAAPFMKRVELEEKFNASEKLGHVGFGAMSLSFTPQAEQKKAAEVQVQKQARKQKNKERRSMRKVEYKKFASK